MTIIEAAVLFGFGIPIVLGCTAFVVMACGHAEAGEQKAGRALTRRIFPTHFFFQSKK